MKDLMKMFRIILKKNALWLFMLFLIFLLIEGSYVKTNAIPLVERSLSLSRQSLEIATEAFDKGDYNVDVYSKVDYNIFKREFQDGVDEDYLSKLLEKADALANKMGVDREYFKGEYRTEHAQDTDFVKKHRNILQVLADFYWEMDGDYSFKAVDNGRYIRTDISKSLVNSSFFIVIIVFVYSALVMSGEHLTKYYEFTRMFPWSRAKSYIAKVILGFIMISIMMAIGIGLKYLLMIISPIKNIISFNYLFETSAIVYVRVMSLYFIIMGLGALAGNFIGHAGLVLMGLVGIRLYQFNLMALAQVIRSRSLPNNHWIYKMDIWINKLPDFIQCILSPVDFLFNSMDSYKLIISLVVLSLIFFLLGLFWASKTQSERSQMLILRKHESSFVKIIAIVTTANMIHMIPSSDDFSIVYRLGLFIIGLFIAKKFYDLLFKAKIGFN